MDCWSMMREETSSEMWKLSSPRRGLDPMSLFPGKSEANVAAELATYFNCISTEWQPLEPGDIPRTHSRALPVLLPFQVEGRTRAFKKPKLITRTEINGNKLSLSLSPSRPVQPRTKDTLPRTSICMREWTGTVDLIKALDRQTDGQLVVFTIIINESEADKQTDWQSCLG